MTLTGLSHAAARDACCPSWPTGYTPWRPPSGWGACWARRRRVLGAASGTAPGSAGEAARALVRRFSTIAITAVLILGSTGLYAILLHVPSWEALVATPYGRALLVKLGLLASCSP